MKPDTNKIIKSDDILNDDLSENDHSVFGDDHMYCL